MKPTLTENYEDVISLEKDLHAIGVIKDDEPSKDLKDTGKRSQASDKKAKEKELGNLEILTRLIKSVTTEMA